MAGTVENKDNMALDTRRQRARPRSPSRDRGVARFNALLDAADTLLGQNSPDDIGLYQIAEAAGVPPASVYHFFPTKEAAFVALVQRYIEGFAEIGKQPIECARLHSWQDLMAIDHQRARNYYNCHPAALKLLYGGFGGLESRKIDYEYVSFLAELTYPRYDRVFHMPYISEPAKLFHISLAILDSIWSLSFLKHGTITDDYADEALAACIAYCRLFLPDRVEVREEVRATAAKNGLYSLSPS